MTTLHDVVRTTSVAYSKGAADVILDGCELLDDRIAERRRSRRRIATRLRDVEQRMAGDGLRVLAIARKYAQPRWPTPNGT